MLHLAPIGPDNWREELEVHEEQKRFVSEPDRILARAYAYRDQGGQARLILDDDTPVGMLLYYDGGPEPGPVRVQPALDRQALPGPGL